MSQLRLENGWFWEKRSPIIKEREIFNVKNVLDGKTQRMWNMTESGDITCHLSDTSPQCHTAIFMQATNGSADSLRLMGTIKRKITIILNCLFTKNV